MCDTSRHRGLYPYAPALNWFSLGRVRRIARILGVLGGLGAILWAMRDRLVSVALPREPQLPAFRVPDSPPASADEAPKDTQEETETSPSVTDVSGIGPVYATRLAAAGIDSLADLAKAEVSVVAESAEVPESKAAAWVEEAGELIASDQSPRP